MGNLPPSPLYGVLNYYALIIIAALVGTVVVTLKLRRVAKLSAIRSTVLALTNFLASFIFGVGWDAHSDNRQDGIVDSTVTGALACLSVAYCFYLAELCRAGKEPHKNPARQFLPVLTAFLLVDVALELYRMVMGFAQAPIIFNGNFYVILVCVEAMLTVALIYSRQFWAAYLLIILWAALLAIEIKLQGLWSIADHAIRVLKISFVAYYVLWSKGIRQRPLKKN